MILSQENVQYAKDHGVVKLGEEVCLTNLLKGNLSTGKLFMVSVI